MSTLYELTGEIEQIYDAVYDEDVDINALAAQMEAAEIAFDRKAEGYAKLIKSWQADAATIKVEEERLRARRQSLEAAATRMKNSLQAAMNLTGHRKVKTPLFSIGIQANPPAVSITDETAIPAEYYVIPAPTFNRAQIAKELKAGHEVPGAELVQSEGVRIR
jgi:hypothetical protein